MTLPAGTRLGPYEVHGLIGAGGMGEVYRARDTKLGRDVAIKVLPASFVRDADRLARFEREARTLASLNHPFIAAIYGYEEAGELRGLILELVEGPTLAQKIERGRLQLREAIAAARAIAEALEAAHERAIIHRDLKPANIKLTGDGRVKVLDFGLAKTVATPLAGGSYGPTTIADRTEAGVVLGTVAYMSPEQTRGAVVDQRTDIWAFGCCLFEMLAGRKAFDGATASDVIAGVLEREPRWDLLPRETPPRIRELLGQCLQKPPEDRLRDIGDARLVLQEALRVLEPGGLATGRATTSRPRRAALAAFAVVAAAVLTWIALQFANGSSATPKDNRLSDGNRASRISEANEYYERALLFGGIGTSNPEQARRMIERALALDGTFAAARAEHAFFEVDPILNGRSNDASTFYRAESAARQALQDDPQCGRAHSVLGLIYLLQGRKELVAAELDEALKANPADATAHGWRGLYHRFNGDYPKAIEQTERLIREWPLFWPARLDRGELLRETGDLRGAIGEQNRVLEQDVANVAGVAALARAYLDSADLQAARRTLERARAEDRRNYVLRQVWALLLALEGKKADASREMDDDLRAYSELQIFGPSPVADYYATMGEVDTALAWLDRAVRLGDDREEYLRRNPLLSAVRSHPRFQQILESVAYRRQQRQSH